MDADELTYQTHIWMRYELERRLLSGELAVKDLREAWNALSSDRLGLVPATDLEGCLQDIHWAIGSFGHFPSYGVGAVIAGQLWEDDPRAAAGHRGGDRGRPVRRPASRGFASACIPWARASACRSSCSTQPAAPLSAAPFLRYLERKYLSEN